MKRKALLAITGCTPKTFETLSFRGFLPFAIEDYRWSDYTIDNAFQLKVLLDAAQGTDLGTAGYLAAQALSNLHPIDPFSFTGDEEMWLGLARFEWDEAPEGWRKLCVVAGRWCDIVPMAKARIADNDPSAKLTSLLTLSATRIARDLLDEARDYGLPEGEVRSLPENLFGYPEWFQEAEAKRRIMLAGFADDREGT